MCSSQIMASSGRGKQDKEKRLSPKEAELLLRLAAKQMLNKPVLERIIDDWLTQFDDPANPRLASEVAKFADLGAQTGLAYHIAFRAHLKVSEVC